MFHLDNLPNKKPDECVERFLRRQWFAWAVIIAAFVFLVGLPATAVFYFWGTVSGWLQDPIFGPLFVVFASMYVLGVWIFSFVEFTDYYLDTWIITTHRVINIEQKGLFNRIASELHLAAVQDVTSEVKGMIRTFFNYGQVFVQTAAERERFQFKDIEHPEEIKELVIRLVEQDKKRHAASMVAQVAEGQKTLEDTV